MFYDLDTHCYVPQVANAQCQPDIYQYSIHIDIDRSLTFHVIAGCSGNRHMES